jgi:hypothetical protein
MLTLETKSDGCSRTKTDATYWIFQFLRISLTALPSKRQKHVAAGGRTLTMQDDDHRQHSGGVVAMALIAVAFMMTFSADGSRLIVFR